jgi:hypothetical protein
MKPVELAEQCARSITFCTEAGIPSKEAGITVVLPKGWKPPPRFPRRELLAVNPRGERVYRLSAVNVLAWLAGNGLVTVEAKVINSIKDRTTP